MSSEHSAFEIAAAVSDMKTEILRDIDAGTLPRDVPDFVALHDHVDANTYAGFTDPNRRADWDVADLVLVQEEVDAWLKARPRDVPPKWVGGEVRLVIECTVSADEYRDFVATHVAHGRDVAESFDARMDEVFGPDGDQLTSVRVKSVMVHP